MNGPATLLSEQEIAKLTASLGRQHKGTAGNGAQGDMCEPHDIDEDTSGAGTGVISDAAVGDDSAGQHAEDDDNDDDDCDDDDAEGHFSDYDDDDWWSEERLNDVGIFAPVPLCSSNVDDGDLELAAATRTAGNETVVDAALPWETSVVDPAMLQMYDEAYESCMCAITKYREAAATSQLTAPLQADVMETYGRWRRIVSMKHAASGTPDTQFWSLTWALIKDMQDNDALRCAMLSQCALQQAVFVAHTSPCGQAGDDAAASSADTDGAITRRNQWHRWIASLFLSCNLALECDADVASKSVGEWLPVTRAVTAAVCVAWTTARDPELMSFVRPFVGERTIRALIETVEHPANGCYTPKLFAAASIPALASTEEIVTSIIVDVLTASNFRRLSISPPLLQHVMRVLCTRGAACANKKLVWNAWIWSLMDLSWDTACELAEASEFMRASLRMFRTIELTCGFADAAELVKQRIHPDMAALLLFTLAHYGMTCMSRLSTPFHIQHVLREEGLFHAVKVQLDVLCGAGVRQRMASALEKAVLAHLFEHVYNPLQHAHVESDVMNTRLFDLLLDTAWKTHTVEREEVGTYADADNGTPTTALMSDPEWLTSATLQLARLQSCNAVKVEGSFAVNAAMAVIARCMEVSMRAQDVCAAQMEARLWPLALLGSTYAMYAFVLATPCYLSEASIVNKWCTSTSNHAEVYKAALQCHDKLQSAGICTPEQCKDLKDAMDTAVDEAARALSELTAAGGRAEAHTTA
jgi:hypothetical protein